MSRHHDAHDLERTNHTIAGISADLRKIAEHYDAALHAPGAADENRGIGSRRQGEPVSTDAIDARHRCMRNLVTWVNFILMEVNAGTITHGPRTVDVDGLTEFIGRWTPAIVDQHPDDAENLTREIRQHAEKIEALAKGWVVKRYQIGRCLDQTITVSPEGVEEFTPCTGSLWAVIHSKDTDLPEAVRCDANHLHAWEPWRWRDLGRRLGALVVQELEPDVAS